MANPITIDIWSDIACPWCYIGKRRLETALAQFAEDADAPGPMLVKLAKSRKMSVADAVALAKDAGRKYINSYDVHPADILPIPKRAAS